MKEFRRSPKNGEPSNYECTAVLGGLAALTGRDEAVTWLSDKLWSLYGPKPVESYCKGDFKGILFAKFASKGERDTAVALLRSAGYEHEGKKVWAKPDMPLEARTVRSFVFAAKNVMNAWGWHELDLWADPDAGTLKLAGEVVISASVKNGALCVEYGAGWEAYYNTADHPEMKQLIVDSDSKIKKGAGKGGDKATAKGRKGIA